MNKKESIKGMSLSRIILGERKDTLEFVHFHKIVNTPVVLNLGILGSENTDFRHGIITYSKKDSEQGKRQIFTQCLGPGENIGWEVHKNSNQLFWVVKGECEVYFGTEKDGTAQLLRPLPKTDKEPPYEQDENIEIESDRVITEGRWFLIPANYWHSVRNTSTSMECKLVTFYDSIVHDYIETEEKKHENYNGIGYIVLFKDSNNRIKLTKVKSIDQLDIPNLHYSCFWKFEHIRYIFEIVSKMFPDLVNAKNIYDKLSFENFISSINNSIKKNPDLSQNLVTK